ncbi:DNA-binding protein [Methanohalophilus sp. RSK]|uniref:RPA family protein n=1 Tax=Methanohalophilus sp. RSK TaxID=2485783 RepID=UPI000F43E130|nr:RPA family protein [Methanohalophilus sp. RSK]RNI11824.1 DNA-binding protein [Methanohalophilus sp. RSK]
MSTYVREVAKRMFAKEFRNSDLSFREGDDVYSPQYLLTPTGARVNRLFIVGTLIEKENIGNEAEYWRGRVTDPTGTFTIYAGQYQPEAAQLLSECETPAFVAVAGKPSVYETPDGDTITSIRPESISIVDGNTRDMWVVDTAIQTINRLHNLDGSDSYVVRAKEHYNTDKGSYSSIVLDALKSLKEQI